MVKNLSTETQEMRARSLSRGRSLGGGSGNPLQYSCLGNPMDIGSLAGCSPQAHIVGHSRATEHAHTGLLCRLPPSRPIGRSWE